MKQFLLLVLLSRLFPHLATHLGPLRVCSNADADAESPGVEPESSQVTLLLLLVQGAQEEGSGSGLPVGISIMTVLRAWLRTQLRAGAP